MTRSSVAHEKLRVALRRLSRGDLLEVAERAIDLVPKAKLRQLVGNLVRLDEPGQAKRGAGSVLAEVRVFDLACRDGQFYEDFQVNSKNHMDKSEGTEDFIAEFERLMAKCIKAASATRRAPVREAFELLLGLLREIDEDGDGLVFFADEAGSWQVYNDWRKALPAYFRCLADGAAADDFAREVDRAITDFNDYDRPRHLAAARRVANAEQKAALRRLPARESSR